MTQKTAIGAVGRARREPGRRPRISRKTRYWLGQIAVYIFMTALAIFFMIPVFWMLSTALKERSQVLAWPPQWIPQDPQWDNFVKAMTSHRLGRCALNSAFLVVLNIVGQLLSVPVIAYAFARLRFPGRNALFILVISTMMIPYQAKMIPLFALYHWLGLIDTYWPLILPAFFGEAFFIFLVRQYMMTIPRELDDAARIDGAGTWTILYRVILPLCKPPMVLVIVYTFLWVWNDFLRPLIYLNDANKFTMQIGLAMFKMRFSVQWDLFMAATLVSLLPCLVIYFLVQRQLIGGIASVGLKG